jgi:hypothetical protein
MLKASLSSMIYSQNSVEGRATSWKLEERLVKEDTKDKYNMKIRKQRVSPKVPPTAYKGQRIK